MSLTPFLLFATSPTPPGLPAPTFSDLLVGILIGMFIVAQFALLGIWLGSHRYVWWQLALGLLGVLVLAPFWFMGYIVVAYATQSWVLALLVLLMPGHLLGAFLGMQLYAPKIAREPNAPARHFQFSMRTLFLFTAAFAVVLGIVVWAARQVDEVFLILFLEILFVVGPPVLLAPLAVWATWGKHFFHPGLMIAPAIALAIALTAAFILIDRELLASPLLLGGEFLIVAAELLALRANSLRLSRSRGSTSSE
jgi:hypothetical protein